MSDSVQIKRPGWCCVQPGHREQYGIPRALHEVAVLDRLITDLWVQPDSWLMRTAPERLRRKLRDRFHSGLPADKVKDYPWHAFAWEAEAGLRRLRDSEKISAHNAWWESLVARQLRGHLAPSTGFVFGYSYASRALFAATSQLGRTSVLGQIDPGPIEDAKVMELGKKWSAYRTTHVAGSNEYYANWREECRLAKRIVVNSEWSRVALFKAGIDREKIIVCPLVYTPPLETAGWEKSYPPAFTENRPLRLLSLGQCILRKGIAETIEAAHHLINRPVEFTFVGNTNIAGFEEHFQGARIRYIPRVSRAECHAFYRNAEVFLFPTHSDGFGLTQLEAQAWKLPIIASAFCGEVVEPGRTGWILPDVSGSAMVKVIEEILTVPARLNRYSTEISPWPFGLNELGHKLVALVDEFEVGRPRMNIT